MHNKKYKVAVGTDLGHVTNRQVSWDKFSEVMTTHVVQEKKGGKYIVAGEFDGNIRDEEYLLCRSMLTLDIDEFEGNQDDITFELEIGIPQTFVAYSTFQHTFEKPRIRVLIPLSRDVTPNEYRLVSRRFCEQFDIKFDPASFKPNQAMYMPSRPVDAEPWVMTNEGAELDVDEFVSGAGSLVVVNEDNEDDFLKYEPLDVSDEEVDSYLDVLSNDNCDYDTWTTVGFALAHQFRGSDEGYQRWVNWSSKSDKHDDSMMPVKWKSFSKERSGRVITFASVIALAGGREALAKVEVEKIERTLGDVRSKDDVENELDRIATLKIDSLTEELLLKKIQKKFKETGGDAPGLPALRKMVKGKRGNGKSGGYVDEYVFMSSSGEFVHRYTKARMLPRSFDVVHGRDTPLTIEGDKQSASTYASDKVECVENAMYVPAFGEVFKHNDLMYLNTYRLNAIEREEISEGGIVSRIEGHLAHLLTDKKEQDIVKYYLAHNVQKPGAKLHWSIVLQGVQGDGKSLLAELMQLVLGYQNVRLLNVQELESKFSGWAAGQCMTFIEELKLDNYRKYEVVNNIKPYISNPSISITEKGKDPRTVLNTTNYFCLTNFKDAIPLDDSDRRWCVLFSQWQRKEKLMEFMESNPDYYTSLYEDMRAGVGELLTWLETLKIPEWFLSLKRAPDTNAKSDMRDLSKSDGYLLVEDAIAEFECGEINDEIVNITMLTKMVEIEGDHSDYKNFPKDRAIKNILADMGYHRVGRYKDKNRKNQTVYAKDDKLKVTSENGKIKLIPN